MSTTTKITAEQFAKMSDAEKTAAFVAMQTQANTARKLTLKVAEKTKCLSLYGLNARFPVTLYVEQWERLIAHVPEITAFIKANNAHLARR